MHGFTDQFESHLCLAADSRLTAHLAVITTYVMLSPRTGSAWLYTRLEQCRCLHVTLLE